MGCAGVALVPVGLKRMVDASSRRRSRTSLAGVALWKVRDEPRVLRFVPMNHLIGRDLFSRVKRPNRRGRTPCTDLGMNIEGATTGAGAEGGIKSVGAQP